MYIRYSPLFLIYYGYCKQISILNVYKESIYIIIVIVKNTHTHTHTYKKKKNTTYLIYPYKKIEYNNIFFFVTNKQNNNKQIKAL